jgi:hypothetical protein
VHRWVGQLLSVKDSSDSFKVYLLLGEPHQEPLMEAFEKAVSILGKIPLEKEIIREQEAVSFSKSFAREIEQHSEAGSERKQ